MLGPNLEMGVFHVLGFGVRSWEGNKGFVLYFYRLVNRRLGPGVLAEARSILVVV